MVDWFNYDKYEAAAPERGPLPHYYGDTVRILFVITTAVWFLALPFYPDILPFSPVTQVVAGLVILILAALTNPMKRWTLVYDALVAGIGIVVFEMAAVQQFGVSSWVAFAVRELIVLLLIVAFYLSLKTVRAMYLRQINIREHTDADTEGTA